MSEAAHLLLLAQGSGGVLLIGGWCAAVLIPRALPALLAANLNLLAVIALWLDASDPEGPTAQAIREGCARPPGVAILALVGVSVGLYLLGALRLKRRIAAKLAEERALIAQAQAQAQARAAAQEDSGPDDPPRP
ncbi:hypothetical protein ACQ5SO_14620 [Rhodovulum sp. DZ06]|uniref:hypothetical protein n=1 Tax=Rhodovulum sp. DZ06 TaxID=3425126 RepID=UPI003D355F9E